LSEFKHQSLPSLLIVQMGLLPASPVLTYSILNRCDLNSRYYDASTKRFRRIGIPLLDFRSAVLWSLPYPRPISFPRQPSHVCGPPSPWSSQTVLPPPSSQSPSQTASHHTHPNSPRHTTHPNSSLRGPSCLTMQMPIRSSISCLSGLSSGQQLSSWRP
jgi:hypothetical protein